MRIKQTDFRLIYVTPENEEPYVILKFDKDTMLSFTVEAFEGIMPQLCDLVPIEDNLGKFDTNKGKMMEELDGLREEILKKKKEVDEEK